MPVLPFAPKLTFVRDSLTALLVEHQRWVQKSGQARVLSLTLPVAHLDPLAVLQALQYATPRPAALTEAGLTGSRYFYLEKPAQAEAMLAGPPLVQLQVEGAQRFQRTQAFVQYWQAQLFALEPGQAMAAEISTTAGTTIAKSELGPRFCCSFTFFDHNRAGAPFTAATVFLPRWQVMCRGKEAGIVINLLLEAATDLGELALDLTTQVSWLRELAHRPLVADTSLTNRSTCGSILTPPASSQLSSGSQRGFRQAVEQVLEMIRRQELHKLVLARSAELETAQPLALGVALAKLRQRYPGCYIFSLDNGRGQTFLGASPERLLSLQDQHLVVDALAGSARRGRTPAEDLTLAQGLLGSKKDRWEHQLIVEFIVQTLQQLGITVQAPALPRLLQLPNIQHLQTLISARVPTSLSLLEILRSLHPTPAVAGVPQSLACGQIRSLEAFERDLYAAPLGWIDAQGNGEFVVGLRSALVEGNRVKLYAGAGIVAGSDPEQEFQEIQLKLQALSATLFAQT